MLYVVFTPWCSTFDVVGKNVFGSLRKEKREERRERRHVEISEETTK